MKNILLLCLFLLPYLNFGQKSKDLVMPMGDGTYTVTTHGATGFTPLGKLRKKAYEIANEFAAKNNSTAEVLSVNETPQSFGVFPNIDLKFRLVSKSKVQSDSKQTTISISSGHSANGKTTDQQIILKNPKQDSNDKFEKLERIGKLFKEGTLTKEEFEVEKKKILSEN